MVEKASKDTVSQQCICILALRLLLHGILQPGRLLIYQKYGLLVGTGDNQEMKIQDATAPEPRHEGDKKV
jgi:hypothetical protein